MKKPTKRSPNLATPPISTVDTQALKHVAGGESDGSFQASSSGG